MHRCWPSAVRSRSDRRDSPPRPPASRVTRASPRRPAGRTCRCSRGSSRRHAGIRSLSASPKGRLRAIDHRHYDRGACRGAWHDEAVGDAKVDHRHGVASHLSRAGRGWLYGTMLTPSATSRLLGRGDRRRGRDVLEVDARRVRRPVPEELRGHNRASRPPRRRSRHCSPRGARANGDGRPMSEPSAPAAQAVLRRERSWFQPDRVAPHSARRGSRPDGQRRRPGALSVDAPDAQSTDRQHRLADPGRRRSWRSENRPTPCRPMPSCRCRRRSGHRMSRCRPR
jgi:hypothetical protein